MRQPLRCNFITVGKCCSPSSALPPALSHSPWLPSPRPARRSRRLARRSSRAAGRGSSAADRGGRAGAGGAGAGCRGVGAGSRGGRGRPTAVEDCALGTRQHGQKRSRATEASSKQGSRNHSRTQHQSATPAHGSDAENDRELAQEAAARRQGPAFACSCPASAAGAEQSALYSRTVSPVQQNSQSCTCDDGADRWGSHAAGPPTRIRATVLDHLTRSYRSADSAVTLILPTLYGRLTFCWTDVWPLCVTPLTFAEFLPPILT